MNKKLLLCPGFIIAAITSFSQEKGYPTHNSQIMIEFAGPGGQWSLQFESRFKKETNGVGYTIGFGVAPYDLEETCNSGGFITVPFGVNYLVGKKDHMLEGGGGMVLKLFGAGTKVWCPEIADNFYENGNPVYFYCLLGYRYQPAFKRLSGRIFVSPLFQKDFSPKAWGGASIGWRLKQAK